jgi:hypothetical protein
VNASPVSGPSRLLLLTAALLCGPVLRASADDLFKVTPQQVASTLEEYFQKATDEAAGCRIREARQELSLIVFKLDKYRSSFSRDEKKSYETRRAGLEALLKQKVDSLVKVNLALIRKNGRTAGNEFRQYLSAQQGLSETELAAVDEAILSSPESEEEYHPPKVPAAVAAEEGPAAVYGQPPAAAPLPSPAHEQPAAPALSKTAPVAPVKQPAREQPHPAEVQPQKPQQPVAGPETEPAPKGPDIARENPDMEAPQPGDEIDKGKTAATATAAKIRALLDENKSDEAMTVFQIYQANLHRFCEARAFSDLKSAVETAGAKDRDERIRTQDVTRKIEQLLDQDRSSEASAELNGAREMLRQYLDKQDYRDLDSRVGKAVSDAARKQAAALGTMRELRGLLVAGRVEDAYVAFDKARPDLDRALSKEDMVALKKDIAGAYDALKDKKKLAEMCGRDIISLIKAGKGSAAMSRFTENRFLLQQYLDRKAFAALEADADKANRGFAANQERARSALFRIDSLVVAGRVQAGKDLFGDQGARIRRDLADDQRFFQTKDRLLKAYDAFKADRALAAQTMRKIEYLISRKEGRKADDQFQQEKIQLQKFLDQSVFEKLDQSVRRAKSEYESNYASTRQTIAGIEELLGNRKIDQAYKAYENAEDDLDFYFGDDKAIAVLEKRVKEAYAGLQERRQWAASQARQIKRLIEKKHGNEAYARFQQARAELAEYTDAKTFSSLDTCAARAGRAYAAARSRAEAGAARIRTMIVQNQVEDAYAAFDTLESDLEFYLEPNAFSAIKTLVEKFNSALQDKKQEALRTTGAINRLIDHNLGDSAFVLFKQNDASLSKYLKGQTYKAVAVRAANAKEDWEKNCRQVKALLTGLRELLDRDRVEAAYGEFDDKRDFLEHYLDKVSFARLETAVRAPYEFFQQKRKQARSTVSVLRRMIGQNRGTEARAEFESWDRDLGQYLPAEEYTDIKTRIAQAYSKSVSGRRDARAVSDKIRRLLNQGMATEAYKIFQDARSNVELYSSKFEFDRLQTEVLSAYDEQEDKRKQVKEYAKKLRQFVSKNKLWDAYQGFEANRRTLREWLDAEDFSDLENTVVGTYEKAKVKVKTVSRR